MRTAPRGILLALAALALTGCGGADAGRLPAQTPATAPPRVADESELPHAPGQEIRLVGRYARATLDAHLGDPARDPGYVVLYVGRRPVRLGLLPRPAEERDRLLDETVEVRGLFDLVAPVAPPGPPAPPELTALPVLMPTLAPMPVVSPSAAVAAP